MKKSTAFCIAGLLVLASAVVFRSLSLAQPADGRPAAVYVHGVLRVSLPYIAPRNGDGDLTVEVLDPEDAVVGGVARHLFVNSGQGIREQDIAISGALPVDDLVWHRLRYRFRYDGDSSDAFAGTTSISQILRRPVIHVLGQQSYLSGGPDAVRLIVTQMENDTPVTSGAIRIELSSAGEKPRTIYSGKLVNDRGTTRADFRFPAGLAGTFSAPLPRRHCDRRVRLLPADHSRVQKPPSS